MHLAKAHPILTLFLLLGVSLSPSCSKSPELPPDAARTRYHLALLFEVGVQYGAETFDHINTAETRILSIDLPGATGPVDGEKRVSIPEDLVRVTGFFSRLKVQGSGLLEVDVHYATPDREGVFATWTHTSETIEAKNHQMPIDHSTYEGYEIVFIGTGTIERVFLYQDHGVSPVFNDDAWSVVGGRLPVLEVAVDVYPGISRSINGITTLELEKFRRVYSGIDAGYEDNPEAWDAAEVFKPLGFLPGRQIAKLGPELEHAYGYPDIPLMTEDPERPGWADHRFFEREYQPDPTLTAKIDAAWPRDLEYAMCLDFWPSWNEPKGLGIRNDLGTPAPELFDSAADLAARYLAARQRLQGRIAPYWEVKNESTIKHEWMYHGEPGYDSWGLLAEFHNKVADRIKEDFPDIKIGGPTSAWMALDANDFGLAREQLRFMDLTRDHLDFYSHHFYEGSDLVINDPRHSANPGTYLPGRLEADLDLLQNHMRLTDNVKPIIISETGSLHGGGDDIDHWILLKNFSSYMIRYMNRADEFRMIVPFLLPVTWWDKEAEHYLMRYLPDGSIEPTHQLKYLQLWSPYRGDLIPALTSTDRITLHAVTEGSVIQVAINNLNPQRATVGLNLHLDGQEIQSIEQTRLYLENGNLHFGTDKLDSLEAIPVAVEETTIVRITLDEPPGKTATWTERSYYGDATLQPTGEPTTFSVNSPTEGLRSATLRVSFGRMDGFKVPLTVECNGKKFESDLKWSDKPGRFFSFVEFDLPPSLVREDNTVTVTIPQEGGHVSSVALIHTYTDL